MHPLSTLGILKLSLHFYMSNVWSLCSYKTLSVWKPPWVVCHQCRPSAKLGTFNNKTLVSYAWGERAGIRIVRMLNMTLKFCSSLKLMAHTSIHIHQSRRGTSERRRWKGHLWQVKRCGLSLHLYLLKFEAQLHLQMLMMSLLLYSPWGEPLTHSLTLILLGL